MPKGVAPAKLSSPTPQNAVQRTRLFARLDAEPGRFWICGPGGSGKTLLAATWLEARGYKPLWLQLDEEDAEPRTLFHYIAVAFGRLVPRQGARVAALARAAPPDRVGAFARGFARKLYELAPQRFAVAFDHVQTVADCSAALEALAVLADEAPHGVPFLLISRVELPPPLAVLHAREHIAILDWRDLRLTLHETKALIAARKTDSEAEHLHALSDGWAAGVVLMSEWTGQRHLGASSVRLQQSALFDYFAQEFLNSVPAELRAFLFASAHLPTMTAAGAAAVSGSSHAGEILDDLARRNFFTMRLPSAEAGYRFHPLLREFLLQQAGRTLSAAERLRVRERAAEALECAGDAAGAADIYCALADWSRLQALLTTRGAPLLAESRHRTVLGWLGQVPNGEIAVRSWLRFWKCRALVQLDPRGALAQLEPAWSAFEREDAIEGLCHVWCAVVDCCLATFDFRALELWLPRLRALRELAPTIRDAALERRLTASTYVALASWCPDADDFQRWEQKALALVRSDELDPEARLAIGSTLVHSWTFMGSDTSLAAEVIQKLRQIAASVSVSPRARLRWLWVDAMNGMRFDEDESLATTFRRVRQAEAIIAELGAQPFGMTFFIGVDMVANLMRGERAAAERAFTRMLALSPARSPLEANRRAFITALYHLHCNQPASALEPARQHAEFEDKNGIAFARIYGQSILALALHVNGRRAEAIRRFSAAKRLAVRYRAPATLCWIYLGLALVALDKGSQRRSARLLRAGLDLMVPLGHVRAFYLNREQMSRLLSVAFETGCHPLYVRRLISIRRLAPPPGARETGWPWALQVYALGGFEVRRDGKPLQFSRKLPRKPLLLLKFLVAAPRARPVREDVLIDALWPEESPVAGGRAFATALYRLRRLIGDETILLRDGLVGLNSSCVWVDAHEFEVLAPSAAVKVYRGPLLPGEHGEDWSLEARERLRRRFVDAVDALGAASLARGDCSGAQLLYERALEAEPAAERLHQGAIRAQVALGLGGEAVAAYRRCERALRKHYGVAPSELTRHLVQSLNR